MSNNRQQLLLEGPLASALLRLAAPMMLGNILQAAYQLTDAYWVGRLGAAAIAAVAIGFPLTFLVIAAGAGLAMAGATLSAQYAGAGRQDLLNHVAAQSMMMIALTSSAFGAGGYLLSPWLLQWLGVASDVVNGALGYLQVSFIGVGFVFLYAMFQALMRGIGQMRIPLLIVAGTVILNFVLDPLFIFGWGPFVPHGVMGAALATLLAQGLAAALGLAVLLRGRHGIQLAWRDFKPDPAYIRQAFLLGAPASIELLTRGLGPMAMASLAAGIGTLTIAAYGVGTSILQIVTIPAMSLSMAVATLLGQNLGAGQPQRARRAAVLGASMGFVVLTLVGIVAYVFAPDAVAFFVPRDPGVIAQGAHFVRIMCLTWGGLAIQLAIVAAFRASGNMTTAMLIALVSQLAFQLPLAWFLSRHTAFGVDGLWLAFPITNVAFALLSIAWFARGGWRNAKLAVLQAPLRGRPS